MNSTNIVEAFHGSTDSSLQLNDPDSALKGLRVDNDLHVQSVVLNQTLDGFLILIFVSLNQVKYFYSQTYEQRLPLEPKNSGLCRQVVVVQRSFM